MTQPNLWQYLEVLRPSLPAHIEIQRRHYGEELWYVLHDKSNGRFHRLSPTAYRLVGLMNGRNRLQQILSLAADPTLYESPNEIPTQQELIELVQYLHVADLLICDFPPNTRELFSRKQHKQQQKWSRLLLNPLTWKFALGNPDAFLNRMMPVARLLASPAMGFIWLVVVAYALLQAGNHWSELTSGQLDNLLAPGNLLLLWLIYPFLKVVHELGHGLFTKVWGGDVHEFGIVIVLGTPLPYVDATAATAFASKPQRMMVSAAGMAVELFFAAVALLIWLDVDDGLLRNILYNIIIIGSVSTLFFNGNPLLRFDGYHLLCDAIDKPNLATRANQQVTYLLQHHGYGVRGIHSPARSRVESVGLVSYGIAAFVYRLGVLATIILLVLRHSLVLGIAIAIWLIFFQLGLPLIKHLIFLTSSQKLATNRRRAVALTAALAVVLGLAFFYLPLPHSTSAEGVLWLPDDAQVRAEAAGEVVEVLAKDGTKVTSGQPLIQLENTALAAQLRFQQASLREVQARYQLAWKDDRSQAQFYAEDIRAIEAEIQLLQKRADSLTVRSPSNGVFALSGPGELVGRYLQQGDSVGLIVKREPPRIRAALTQQEIGLVRQATRSVEVRLAGDVGHLVRGDITQQVPAGTFTLPSPVLGTSGGGRLAVKASQADGTQTAQMIFLVDVSLPTLQPGSRYGERAYILFRHPPEALARRIYRSFRQLFISNIQR